MMKDYNELKWMSDIAIKVDVQPMISLEDFLKTYLEVPNLPHITRYVNAVWNRTAEALAEYSPYIYYDREVNDLLFSSSKASKPSEYGYNYVVNLSELPFIKTLGEL